MLVRSRNLANRRRDPQQSEIFRLPIDEARRKAREIINQIPHAEFKTVVENWQLLPDGQIEFRTRRLPAADQVADSAE
jgi:hypothetical protein